MRACFMTCSWRRRVTACEMVSAAAARGEQWADFAAGLPRSTAAVLIWGAFCQGGREKRRPQPSLRPPLPIGRMSPRVGVERVDGDAWSSLKCAGCLPQDRGFESELTACLGSSVNTLRGNEFAHRTDADHPETLADTVCLLIWTVVGVSRRGQPTTSTS